MQAVKSELFPIILGRMGPVPIKKTLPCSSQQMLFYYYFLNSLIMECLIKRNGTTKCNSFEIVDISAACNVLGSV